MRHVELVETICRRIKYEPETGRCFWIDATKFHSQLNGLEAGSLRQSGTGHGPRWVIKLNGISVYRARVAFVSTYKRVPLVVDHINGDVLDDRIVNLREANFSENNWNRALIQKPNGLPVGVRQLRNGTFQARIARFGKTKCFGGFATAEDAYAVYLEEKRKLHGEFFGRLA